MNPADISDILPTIEQQKTRFVQITHKKQKQQYIESSTFLKIFYRKRTMKELLEERTALCIALGLTSSRKQNNNLNPATIASNFCLLFKDSPSLLDEFSWTILEDRGTVYGFCASQQKYLPHCKACNFSVYLSLRNHSGRIVCSNRKCKLQLLSQFELASNNKKDEAKEGKQRAQRSSLQVAVGGKIEEKAQTTLQEMEMIKRAAKRIVN